MPTLKKLGISTDQSSDWQKLAAIPEPEFEKRLTHAARDPKTMTTAKLLRPVSAPIKDDPFEKEREVWAGVSGWLGRARDLPAFDELKSVRPTGGSRAGLCKNFLDAEAYFAGLKRLHKEEWFGISQDQSKDWLCSS